VTGKMSSLVDAATDEQEEWEIDIGEIKIVS
jgi:hypothetical protein